MYGHNAPPIPAIAAASLDFLPILGRRANLFRGSFHRTRPHRPGIKVTDLILDAELPLIIA